jgi:hypothetical protein
MKKFIFKKEFDNFNFGEFRHENNYKLFLNQVVETDGGDGFVSSQTFKADEHVGETVLNTGKVVEEDLGLGNVTHN